MMAIDGNAQPLLNRGNVERATVKGRLGFNTPAVFFSVHKKNFFLRPGLMWG
jgi:hypothetical protein